MNTHEYHEVYGSNPLPRTEASRGSGRLATAHAAELVAKVDHSEYHGQHLAAVLAMERQGGTVTPEDHFELGAE